MADNLVLSDDEIEFIQKRRLEKARMTSLFAKRRELLEVASRYYTWLLTNGRGTSFSTFVDEFGYQQSNANRTYTVVCELIQTVEAWD